MSPVVYDERSADANRTVTKAEGLEWVRRCRDRLALSRNSTSPTTSPSPEEGQP